MNIELWNIARKEKEKFRKKQEKLLESNPEELDNGKNKKLRRYIK